MSKHDERDLPYGVRVARGLLADFTAQGIMVTQANAGHPVGLKKGPRGLRIAARARRRRALQRRLQRIAWCSYFELMKGRA